MLLILIKIIGYAFGLAGFVFGYLAGQKNKKAQEIFDSVEDRMGTIFPPRSYPTEEEEIAFKKYKKAKLKFLKISFAFFIIAIILFVVSE